MSDQVVIIEDRVIVSVDETRVDVVSVGTVIQTGGGGGAVQSVNGQVGVVQLTHDDLPSGAAAVQYTPTERIKLTGIAPGATQNASDAALRDRATHTGSQTISTVTGLDVALGNKADLVAGVIPTSQIPGVALTTGQAVGSRSAMLALRTVQEGDIVSITAGSDKGTYILGSGPVTNFGSWLLLSAPTDVVTSINGQQGTVVIGKADVGLSNADNTSDLGKPISTATQIAIDTAQATAQAQIDAKVSTVVFSGSWAARPASGVVFWVDPTGAAATPIGMTVGDVFFQESI